MLSATDRALAVTPLSGMDVWEREARALGYDGTVLLLNDGTVAQRAAKLDELGGGPGLVVATYDTVWRPEMRRSLLHWRPQSVAADEAQKLKDRTTRRSKFMHALGDLPWVERKLPMTGTPVTNSPLDLWSIFRFMDAKIFAQKYPEFRDEYCKISTYLGFPEVKGYKNLDQLREIVAAHSFSIKKSEAIPHLPPRTDEVISVPLTGMSRIAYHEMKLQSLTDILDAAGASHRALATIVLTRMMRLQQITSGFVKTQLPNGRPGPIVDIGAEKLKVCRDLVETIRENGEQVVIFCRFLHDTERLRIELGVPQEHVMTGATPGPARAHFERQHLAGQVPIAICQLKVAALSWDLIRACHGIYYSWDFSVENFTQSHDRLHGRGQLSPVTYWYLVAPETIDGRVLSDLMADIEVAGKVVDLDYVRSLLVG